MAKLVEAPSNAVFIAAISFLAIYALLVGLMPAELIVEAQDFRSTTYDIFYESSEIELLANRFTQNITYGGGYYSDYWGTDEDFGHSFFYVTALATGDADWVMLNNHYYPFWFIVEIPTGVHHMDWVSKQSGETFTPSITNLDFESVTEVTETDSGNITHAGFLVRCPHVTMHATIYFNSTAYANSTTAWQNDGLHCEFAINWDELGTGLNGWNLISSILWFQAPNVHPYVNFLIAFPLWVDIALIIFKTIMVIISVLPFT